MAKLFGVLALGILVSACSITIQSPVREVAYDFSDRDFYDRAYAPSPTYAGSPELARPMMVRGAPPRDAGEAGTR